MTGGVPAVSDSWFGIALVLGAVPAAAVLFAVAYCAIAFIGSRIHKPMAHRSIVIVPLVVISIALVAVGAHALSSMEDQRVSRSNVAALERHYGVSDVSAKTPIRPTKLSSIDVPVSFRDSTGRKREGRITSLLNQMFLDDSKTDMEYDRDAAVPYDYGSAKAHVKAPTSEGTGTRK